jgi:hypothetical protein
MEFYPLLVEIMPYKNENLNRVEIKPENIWNRYVICILKRWSLIWSCRLLVAKHRDGLRNTRGSLPACRGSGLRNGRQARSDRYFGFGFMLGPSTSTSIPHNLAQKSTGLLPCSG